MVLGERQQVPLLCPGTEALFDLLVVGVERHIVLVSIGAICGLSGRIDCATI